MNLSTPDCTITTDTQPLMLDPASGQTILDADRVVIRCDGVDIPLRRVIQELNLPMRMAIEKAVADAREATSP